MKKLEISKMQDIYGGTWITGSCVAVTVAAVVATVSVVLAPIGGLLAFLSGVCSGYEVASWFTD